MQLVVSLVLHGGKNHASVAIHFDCLKKTLSHILLHYKMTSAKMVSVHTYEAASLSCISHALSSVLS